tara:strand:- start:2183 stop:3286 length:1104 start_codon:yes stop_codon:yes gene_type:complete
MNKYFLVFFYCSLISIDAVTSSTILNDLSFDDSLRIEVYASDIDSPRQMTQGDDGRLYVGSRQSGKIFALRDTDNNGVSDSKELVAEDLIFATGVSFYNGDLYLSEISKIWKIENIASQLNENPGTVPKKILITDNLPSDEWHGWKWLQHDENGNLYTNVGAPCNVCLEDDLRYASILRWNNDKWDFIAKGVRNSVGFDFHPDSKKLFFTDNGRDWLGDDSPSCELNRVDSNGQFFGFPFKHASNILDPEFGIMNSGFTFTDPIVELGAHVAPTGMIFYKGDLFPEYKNNIFITLHGSWNRSQKVGYKVIRVILDENGEVLEILEFISGWLKDEQVSGRPAAPFMLQDGSILISDDKADLIYRVTPK